MAMLTSDFKQREFVAVTSYPDEQLWNSLKQKALYFDRIAVDKLQYVLPAIRDSRHFSDEFKRQASELEWLLDNGVLAPIVIEEYLPIAPADSETVESAIENGRLPTEPAVWRRLARDLNDFKFRTACSQLEERHAADAVWLAGSHGSISSAMSNTVSSDAATLSAIEIVIEGLPEPDDSVPWERIIEFRQDQDLRRSLRELRYWVRGLVKQKPSARDIRGELEHLTDQYVDHMRLHDIKTRRGTMETLIVGTAEVLEDLAKVKWGKVVERPFATSRKVARMEAEDSAPGKEIAYLIKAREAFGKPS